MATEIKLSIRIPEWREVTGFFRGVSRLLARGVRFLTRKLKTAGGRLAGLFRTAVRRVRPAGLAFLRNRLTEIRKQPWWLAVAVLVAAGMWLRFGWRGGVLWFLFMMFLLYDWDDRVIGSAALASLVSCPILLALKKEAAAETMAVWAFFFLTMTVALQIVSLRRHPERFEVE